MKNPFTKESIDYPLFLLDFSKYEFHIRHETPFTDRCSEWAVTILENGDTVYIPAGANRCRNIYIILDGYQFQFPSGVYAIPKDCFIMEDFYYE